LPLVKAENSKKLIGIITRGDIGRIYDPEIRSRFEDIKLSGRVEDVTESPS